MAFVYRLQKILEFRIRKKEEQLRVVQKAQQAVYIAQQNIAKNNQEIAQTQEGRRTADYKMMEYYDKFLHHLWEKAEELEIALKQREQILQQEIQRLFECEKEVNVLDKHKEKMKELYIEEQKAIELKMLSEIGSQRHFIRSREEKQEEELRLEDEKSNNNEANI